LACHNGHGIGAKLRNGVDAPADHPGARFRNLAVLALAVAMSTAQAQEQEGKFIIGPRDFSCGKWTNTPKNTAQQDVLGSWLFGYLSGINAENAGVDFLRGREPDELMAWIDNYCQRNPVHGITQAINELIKELQSGR
jgi:hypothetical protein